MNRTPVEGFGELLLQITMVINIKFRGAKFRCFFPTVNQ